ncbi:MAG: DUF2201 family putative metallopeptidase [Anaerolineales bacterium]
MSLLRHIKRRVYKAPSTEHGHVKRPREDTAGLSRAARPRDRDTVREQLKADEAPVPVPVRQRQNNAPPRHDPPPQYTGLQFVEMVRAGEAEALAPALAVLPSSLYTLWMAIEWDIDYAQAASKAYMYLAEDGVLVAYSRRRATLREWGFYSAHLIAHLALGYVAPPKDSAHPDLWCLAAEIQVNSLAAARMGRFGVPSGFFRNPLPRPGRFGDPDLEVDKHTPETMVQDWLARGSPPRNHDQWVSPAGRTTWDVWGVPEHAARRFRAMYKLQQIKSLQKSVDRQRAYTETTVARAFRWVGENFPLLSAATANFDIDYESAEALDIAIAAVAAKSRRIFVNPQRTLSEAEWRWVIVHEILHVVLEHHLRVEDRHPMLWNVACDYVINNWLEDMGVGTRPEGVLYDERYKGRDAESIYDELLKNCGNDTVRLVSLRGAGMGDMLDFDPEFTQDGSTDNDPFAATPKQLARAAARQMQEDAENRGIRGNLPAGLLYELGLSEATAQEGIIPEWKAELARWFAVQFTPKPPERSYKRINRRQAAVPYIPLAGRATREYDALTFAVVLDTSGSMSAGLLQRGLGAVVAFAGQHGIQQVRLVMCDARPYDEGFIPLTTLQKPYRIRGRGGTRLQPAVNLLMKAEDLPPDAPILIITDGAIDNLTVPREHAYLLPGEGRLPFAPGGPVFNILGENSH